MSAHAIRLAAFAALVLLLAGCYAKPELREFAPPGADFVVMIPGEPRHKEQTQDTPDGPITAHAWASEFDDVVYAVSAMTFPESFGRGIPKMGTQAALDHGRDNLLAATPGATINRIGYMTAKDGSELITGSEFELALAGGATMTIRQFVKGDTFYQVATTVPANPVYDQELYAMRFLDSFAVR